jgi:predicted dehydrogenase
MLGFLEVLRFDKKFMTKKLKIGIAGYGIVGKRRRTCIDNHPQLEVVAVCDQSFECHGSFSDGVRYYSTYQQLLTEKLDALIVCMTNDINPDATVAALERRIHVFCEKPPGRKLEDLVRIMNVENEVKDTCLMYGFNHRYHESIRDAIEIVKSKNLGCIINLRGVYGKSKVVTFNQSDWRTKRSVAGGGVLLDQGIHMVDLMRLFSGEFIEVKSFINNSHWNYDVEDNAYALMRTADGVVAMLHSSATQWKHCFNLHITLERGALSLGGILTGSKSYGDETLTVTTVDQFGDIRDSKETITSYNDDRSWELEINAFADCVLHGKPAEHGSSKDAFNTMKLVYQIYYADPLWRDQFNISNPCAYTND